MAAAEVDAAAIVVGGEHHRVDVLAWAPCNHASLEVVVVASRMDLPQELPGKLEAPLAQLQEMRGLF